MEIPCINDSQVETLRDYTKGNRAFIQARTNPEIDDVPTQARLKIIDYEIKELIDLGFLEDISKSWPGLAEASKGANRDCRLLKTTDLAVQMFGDYDPTRMATVN